MNGLEFGQLREDELKEAYELCTRTFGEFVSFENVFETYKRCRDDKNYHFIVGRCDGKIVAYATMALVYNLFDGTYPVAYLWYVCVHEDCYKEIGSQAISYTTGVPAMIGAMMILTGKWKKPGVYNIEEFDPDPFMDALNKWGLPWRENFNPVLVP